MYSEISKNKRKTAYIFVGFMIFVLAMSWVVGIFLTNDSEFTPYLTLGLFAVSILYAIIAYYAGSKMALAVNGAQEIKKSDDPRLFRIVENLSITEGLPMPKVYIMDDPALNAFATGRNPKHAVVCATTGLLETLNDQELEGVMAHELGHVKNYDIRVSMFAFGLVSAVSLLADLILHIVWFGGNRDNRHPLMYVAGIFAIIVAPLAAAMIQMAISRRREFLADATGALTTRYPEGLAGALEKIEQYGSSTKRANSSTAHLFFANPLKKGSFAGLFSTHPTIKERVKILRGMSDKL